MPAANMGPTHCFCGFCRRQTAGANQILKLQGGVHRSLRDNACLHQKLTQPYVRLIFRGMTGQIAGVLAGRSLRTGRRARLHRHGAGKLIALLRRMTITLLRRIARGRITRRIAIARGRIAITRGGIARRITITWRRRIARWIDLGISTGAQRSLILGRCRCRRRWGRSGSRSSRLGCWISAR